MTTLLVSDNFPPRTGGSGRWFWEVYRRLPRDRFLVAAGEHPRQAEFDTGHDVRVVRLPLTLPAWGLRSVAGLRGYAGTVRRLAALIRAEGVLELHCGRCLPEGFMAWLLSWWAHLPYVCYVHGEDVMTAGTSRELSWMVRRVLGAAKFVVANSRNTAGLLTGRWGLPPERVRLLHPGVDTSRFVPAPRDPAARARLGWGDRPVVLTVGRLQKRKGHDMMIRALASIRARVGSVLYAVVGDGEERATLEALAAAEGVAADVRFLGEVDDDALAECYRQCDLFALPNRQVGEDIEGFGMVLLEAQACGRPVLAGASGGTAETMRAAETGVVVPCDEPAALADAVAGLLADPARLARMGTEAREWVVERFDWEALARQARDLFGVPAGAREAAGV
jgi:phosphatidylinositol alpha-1,6-mannosyltransferase